MSAAVLSFRLVAAVPNLLSTVRLGLAVAFPVLDPVWRGPAVLVAGLTDCLDGYLARRLGFTSWQGGLLDAIADKLFVLVALCTLTLDGTLALVQVGLLLARDVTVAVIAAYVALRRQWQAFTRMPSRRLGKFATAAIYGFLLLRLFGAELDWLHLPAFTAAAALTILAAVDYLFVFAGALRTKARQTRQASVRSHDGGGDGGQPLH